LNYAEPIANEDTILFVTPLLLNTVLTGIAMVVLVSSVIRLGGEIMNPYPIK
jgi:hypothetical protein